METNEQGHPGPDEAPREGPLQLPFDFHRTSATKTRLACHAFQLPLPEAAEPDALLAAAFGVLLFRYNAQSSITLNASRLSAAGEIRWRQPFRLSTEIDAIGQNVLSQAREFFRRIDAPVADRRSSDRHCASERRRDHLSRIKAGSRIP